MKFATYKCSACGKEFNVIVGHGYSEEAHCVIARHNWTGTADNEGWAATHPPLCEECRQKEGARIAKEAKKQGLPELRGNANSVALGEMIRKDILSLSDAAMNLLHTKEFRDAATSWDGGHLSDSFDYIDKALALIKSAASSYWWVDVCDRITVEYVAEVILSEADHMAREAYMAKKREEEDEYMRQATIFPDNHTKGTVYFSPFSNNIWVVYKEHDDAFEEICREHGLHLIKPTMWGYSGASAKDLMDHVAALTEHLLSAGFAVLCFNESFLDALKKRTFSSAVTTENK